MAEVTHINVSCGDWQTSTGARGYWSRFLTVKELLTTRLPKGWYIAPTYTSRDVLEIRIDLPVTFASHGAVTTNPNWIGNVADGD